MSTINFENLVQIESTDFEKIREIDFPISPSATICLPKNTKNGVSYCRLLYMYHLRLASNTHVYKLQIVMSNEQPHHCHCTLNIKYFIS